MLKSVICFQLLRSCVLPSNDYLDHQEELEQPNPIVQEYKEESKVFEMEATFYGPDCKGCSGITKVGYNVKNTIYVENMRVIAVDPRIIALNSIVKVELEDGQVFKALAADIGSDIKGNRIDVLVSSEKESFKYGRQKAKITILGVDE